MVNRSTEMKPEEAPREGLMAVIVQCEQCATKYTVPDEKVPAGGIRAQCKGCGHIVLVSRPAPQLAIDEPSLPAAAVEQMWSCACGASNAPDADACETCGQPQTGLAEVAVEPDDSGPEIFETPKRRARSASLVPWRSLLFVGALAVIVGVGASYVLGQALNRSLASFLAAIFK